MNSAHSDPSTGAQGAAAPAGEPAGGMPSAFANGLPGSGGSSAPASPTPPASAGTPQAGESPAGASPDTPKPQADPFAQRLREHEVNQRQQWQEQVNQWRRQATEDPQIGGANLPATVARAQLALDRFDEGKRIGQMLEQTGYGNNPDVLRFFNRLADVLMEDGLVQGQAGGAMPPLEERMYAGWSSRSGRV